MRMPFAREIIGYEMQTTSQPRLADALRVARQRAAGHRGGSFLRPLTDRMRLALLGPFGQEKEGRIYEHENTCRRRYHLRAYDS